MLEQKSYMRKCVINGEILDYDVCNAGSLQKAKDYYVNFKYIGTGIIYSINGQVIKSGNEIVHFFVKK